MGNDLASGGRESPVSGLEQPAYTGRSPSTVVAVLLLAAFALYQAVAQNNFPDFFIYRAGAVIGLRGESPYDPEAVKALVAGQFPDAEDLIANCGFFLPPLAIPVFAPFAVLPYPVAKVAWAILMGLSGAATLLVLRLFTPPAKPSLVGHLVPFLLLLNLLTLAIVVVGQTTLLFVGAVAAGQWCFDNRRPTLGAILWAIPFVKPHLALPLLPLAWYLGGWKRAAAVAGVVAGLNAIGCLIAGVSPGTYLDFLRGAHKAVEFNRVELNPQISSWNRVLIAFGGPAIELTAVTTLAGYLVWFGLVLGRGAAGETRPSPAWATAAAAVGAVLCAQVLGYELLVLVLAVPWVRELFAGGWKARGWLAIALIGVQLVPRETMEAVGIGSHRALAVACLALLVLIGPTGSRGTGFQPVIASG